MFRTKGKKNIHLVCGRLTVIRRPACVPAPAENKVPEAYENAKKVKREL
jgi:hypothetical protein